MLALAQLAVKVNKNNQVNFITQNNRQNKQLLYFFTFDWIVKLSLFDYDFN